MTETDPTPDVEETPDPIEVLLSTADPRFVAALDEEIGQNIAEITPPNRAQRRANVRRMRRLVIGLDAGVKRLHHPLLSHKLMPWGVRELKRRRRAEELAKRARQVNRGGGRRGGAARAGAPKTPKKEKP